jgi:hypothetical protein
MTVEKLIEKLSKFDSKMKVLGEIKPMTIAQQLKVKDFPFEIKDNKGNEIYYENSNGFWIKREYDSKGNEIYYEHSTGFWAKREYDSKGNIIYFEDSNGYIEDSRPKDVELSLDDIATKFGIDVKHLKIKK